MKISDKMFAGSLEEDAMKVKVIGVGGAGTNAVDKLKLDNLKSVNFAAVNTDAQALDSSPIEETCMIGRSLTRGLSTGGEREIGRKAALSDRDKITQVVSGCELVFIVAGLGGGTGGGAAPVVAEIASEKGALVIGFVTLPFTMEGGRRQSQAYEALAEMRSNCDAVIALSNDLLLQHVAEDATVLDAFDLIDGWVGSGIESICSMLFRTGIINLDFTSLKSVFSERGGKTLFSLGKGSGENYVNDAVEDLMMCPLMHLPESARSADRLLINLTGGPGLSMADVNKIVGQICSQFKSANETVIGTVIDEQLSDSLEICVIGTTDINNGKGVSRRNDHAAVIVDQPMGIEAKPDPIALPDKSEVDLKGGAEDKRTEEAVASVFRRKEVHESKLTRAKKKDMKDTEQSEFGFVDNSEQRGYFDNTERNLFDGEDLDVPTFMRRGIKIAV